MKYSKIKNNELFHCKLCGKICRTKFSDNVDNYLNCSDSETVCSVHFSNFEIDELLPAKVLARYIEYLGRNSRIRCSCGMPLSRHTKFLLCQRCRKTKCRECQVLFIPYYLRDNICSPCFHMRRARDRHDYLGDDTRVERGDIFSRFVSTKYVASVLGCSREHVRKLAKSADLPMVKIGRWSISKSKLDEWVRQKMNNSICRDSVLDSDGLIGTKEVSETIACTRWNVTKMAKSGKVPMFKMGAHYKMTKNDFEMWLKDRVEQKNG